MLGNRNPSTTEEAEASDTLNALLKRWDSEGNWVWAISATPTILNLTADVETYSWATAGPPTKLASDILELVRFEIWRGNKPDYQLEIRTQEDWMASRLRKENGQPTEVYLQTAPVLSANVLFVAPVPQGALEARYYYQRRIYDFTAATDLPDLPQEWVQTMKFGLAAELGPEYGTNLERQMYLDGKTEMLLKKMKKADAKFADPSRQRGTFF